MYEKNKIESKIKQLGTQHNKWFETVGLESIYSCLV